MTSKQWCLLYSDARVPYVYQFWLHTHKRKKSSYQRTGSSSTPEYQQCHRHLIDSSIGMKCRSFQRPYTVQGQYVLLEKEVHELHTRKNRFPVQNRPSSNFITSQSRSSEFKFHEPTNRLLRCKLVTIHSPQYSYMKPSTKPLEEFMESKSQKQLTYNPLFVYVSLTILSHV